MHATLEGAVCRCDSLVICDSRNVLHRGSEDTGLAISHISYGVLVNVNAYSPYILSRETAVLGLVDNAIADLKLNYQNVYAVGHSMGCSLLALADRDNMLDKAVMIAPAVKMKHPLKKTLLKELKKEGRVLDIPWQSDPSYHLHYEGAPSDDEYYGVQYWSHLYPSQMLDLYNAMDKAAPLFKKDSYLALYGKKDELCSYGPKSLEKFSNYYGIEEGTHYLPYDRSEAAERMVLSKTLSFLDQKGEVPSFF